MNVSETLSLSSKFPLSKAGIIDKINISQMSVHEIIFHGGMYALPVLSGEIIAYTDGEYIKAMKAPSADFNYGKAILHPVKYDITVSDQVLKLDNAIAMSLYNPLCRLRDVLVEDFGVENSLALIEFIGDFKKIEHFQTIFRFYIAGYGAI